MVEASTGSLIFALTNDHNPGLRLETGSTGIVDQERRDDDLRPDSTQLKDDWDIEVADLDLAWEDEAIEV